VRVGVLSNLAEFCRGGGNGYHWGALDVVAICIPVNSGIRRKRPKMEKARGQVGVLAYPWWGSESLAGCGSGSWSTGLDFVAVEAMVTAGELQRWLK
jgi:hypothetical protein